MRQPTEICTPITYDELTVLSGWCGLKKYYGFHGSAHEFDQRQLLKTIQDLCQKGAIASDGNRFRVCEPYKEMLRYLANSREIWSVTAAEKPLPPICCYVGEQILMLSPSAVREETLQMEFEDREEFLEHLEMEGYLPEELSLSEEEWIFRPDGRELLTLQRITENAGPSATLQVLEFPEGFTVHISDPQREERVVFSKKKMLEILESYWRSAK